MGRKSDVQIAIEILSFWALDPEKQISLLQDQSEIKAWFFDTPNDSNYFYGLSCAYSEYFSFLVGDNESGDELLLELSTLFDFIIFCGTPIYWSSYGLSEYRCWRLVRRLARLALRELKVDPKAIDQQFRIEELINIDDYKNIDIN